MRITFILIHIIAATIPFFEDIVPKSNKVSVSWPKEFEGAVLIPVLLTEKERAFSRGFPGQIARFTDGSREIIFRRIVRASRKLHPAADCLKGSGFTVEPRPIRIDFKGKHWGCVEAKRLSESLHVCEQIYDMDGQSWSDTSSWFWSALLNRTQGPWSAVTIAEKI